LPVVALVGCNANDSKSKNQSDATNTYLTSNYNATKSLSQQISEPQTSVTVNTLTSESSKARDSSTLSGKTSQSNGTSSNTSSTSGTTKKQPDKTKSPSTEDVLKTYITDNSITKTQFLACVAYMENGKIKDTFFESFVFTPTPAYMYDYISPYGGKRLMKKENWLSYIYDEMLKSGKNMDALNEAAETLKEALGLKDYKVKVYLSLLYPVQGVTEFGTVNGKNLNFSKEADRLEGVKWFAQESLKAFNSKKYQNLEVAGFSWFTEEVEMNKDASLIKGVTDYIRSIGYTSIWSPYFHAQGFDKGLTVLGFDKVSMQPNYYPDSPNIPNNGNISRLTQTANYVKSLGIGVELELGSSRAASVKGFKEYMKIGIEQNYMNAYHVWYLNAGPNLVYTLYHSRDPYIRSAYDEMYLFVKRKLKVSDILL